MRITCFETQPKSSFNHGYNKTTVFIQTKPGAHSFVHKTHLLNVVYNYIKSLISDHNNTKAFRLLIDLKPIIIW